MAVQIFPAFGTEYSGKELVIPGIEEQIDLLSRRIDNRITADMIRDNPRGNFSDELDSQLTCYLFSCALAELLRDHTAVSRVVGYSMGIYAALYRAGGLTFEAGFALIEEVYQSICRISPAGTYAVAATVGFSEAELSAICSSRDGIDIINVNSPHNILLAGLRGVVEEVLENLIEQGALSAKVLPFSAPYHSPFMKEGADRIRGYIEENVDLADLQIPLISCRDQRSITSSGDILDEIITNIYQPIHWLNTLSALISQGETEFLECGPGKSLNKMGRFIEGDFSIYSVPKISRFLS